MKLFGQREHFPKKVLNATFNSEINPLKKQFGY
ncbi:hypothetical protein C809_04076 [Lachnospiraceae bacterium MD335]|nr:hypothetical protein C809_04076 [Lachnospiraceae bacterium MD335]